MYNKGFTENLVESSKMVLQAKLDFFCTPAVVDYILDTIGESILPVIVIYPGELIDFDAIKTDDPVIIVDLNTINYTLSFDTYFIQLKKSLPLTAIYISCIENISARKNRFRQKYPKPILQFVWFWDLLVHRFLSKTSPTKYLYKLWRNGNYQVISRAETLGRLYYEGFELINFNEIEGKFYFSTIKTSHGRTEKRPSSGFLIKLKRIGKDGKIINVYKIRSMHAYSEYLQGYLVKINGYNEIGKPNNDFRLANWAVLFRKLHLDELPQLINVLKRDMNLVGVRPLSKFGFSSLPQDLQEKRIKFKPGCIPPNKALGLTGFEGVIEAERIYLQQREKWGWIINIKYFWMTFFKFAKKRNLSS